MRSEPLVNVPPQNVFSSILAKYMRTYRIFSKKIGAGGPKEAQNEVQVDPGGDSGAKVVL